MQLFIFQSSLMAKRLRGIFLTIPYNLFSQDAIAKMTLHRQNHSFGIVLQWRPFMVVTQLWISLNLMIWHWRFCFDSNFSRDVITRTLLNSSESLLYQIIWYNPWPDWTTRWHIIRHRHSSHVVRMSRDCTSGHIETWSRLNCRQSISQF